MGTGSTDTSLLILGPMSTFALPAVAMIAFWWNDWPGSTLTTPWTGLIDTALVIAAAVLLTIAGQAIVERSDVRGYSWLTLVRRSGDVSRDPGCGRRGVHGHAAAVAGLRTLAAGRYRAAPVRHRRACCLVGGRDRRLLPVRQPRRRTGRRAGRGRAAQSRRPGRRTRLRLGAHRRRPLAGGGFHRPARLARQHHHPAAGGPITGW
jgi:hypothetical protein